MIKGQMLKELRVKRDLSQKLVSDTIGISRSQLAMIETGKREITEELEKSLMAFYSSFEINENLEVKFDYIRIRFPTHDVKMVVEEILCMAFEFFYDEDTKMYGYKEIYKLGAVWVFASGEGDERGTLVQMSGEGCRHYETVLEERQESWKDFLKRCGFAKGSATRIDVAIDDYRELFSLEDLSAKILLGHYETKFRTMRVIHEVELNSGSQTGYSLYFGSNKSKIYFNFYKKSLELEKKEGRPAEEFDVRNRYEIRMKDEKARGFLEMFMKHFDFSELILGVVANQITVLDRDHEGNLHIWDKWGALVRSVEKVHIRMAPEKPTFYKKLAYLQTQAASSLKVVEVVDGATGTTRLKDILENTELSKKDEKLIQLEIASISDYVRKTGVLL